MSYRDTEKAMRATRRGYVKRVRDVPSLMRELDRQPILPAWTWLLVLLVVLLFFVPVMRALP